MFYEITLFLLSILSFLVSLITVFLLITLIVAAAVAICTKPDSKTFMDDVKFFVKHGTRNPWVVLDFTRDTSLKRLGSDLSKTEYCIDDWIFWKNAVIIFPDGERSKNLEFLGLFGNWHYIGQRLISSVGQRLISSVGNPRGI